MQQLPSFLPGIVVSARDRTWRVERVTRAPGCAAVDLVGAEAATAGRGVTLVVPFDEVTPSLEPEGAAAAGPAAALRRLAELMAETLPWPVPSTARDACMDLHPHQLSAAMAFATGSARRVLVADAVGTGKTVQAGLAIAETVAEAPCARVLVAVPSSLKAQWQRELRHRFAIDARIVETVLPAAHGDGGTSPWTGRGVAIASFDYVKRVDVLGGLDATWWHLLVIDEAHHGAGRTDRGEALRALARRALRVLMLTATPHDGDDGRFASLRAIGATGPSDALLTLARAPRGAVHARRRVHVRQVRASREEDEAGRLLERYLDSLARETGGPAATSIGLLASVLRKRAASSPAALARSVERRRELLAADPPAEQLALAFGAEAVAADTEDDGDSPLLGLRIAPDSRHERAWLGAVAEAARRAARHCAKLRALIRLLRRVGAPAVVFTEYRDTLAWLHGQLRAAFRCDVLHGLQSSSERLSATEAFVAGRIRVLLATDAAAEGLNLQASCRVAVLFDLPWTPARIEQRIGRVDRLGQQRRVHAWMLRTAADTPLVAHLEVRAARAARATGNAGPPWSGCANEGGPPVSIGGAEVEAARHLARARAWRSAPARHDGPARAAPPARRDDRALVACLSSRRLSGLGVGAGRALVLLQAVFARGDGRVLERGLWPVVVRLDDARATPASRARRHDATRAISAHAARAAEAAIEARRLLLQCLVARADVVERSACDALARSLRTAIAAHFVQPGLFDASAIPERAPGPDTDLPARPEPSPVTATLTTPLLLLPRGWP